MKKEKLRFLALGFFLSALVLTLFQLVVQAGTMNDAESSLAAESSVESSISSSTKEAESSQVSVENESSESGNFQESPSNDDAFVFVVHEGQPSSVVIENLHTSGLIKNPEEAQSYLEEQNLMNSIQYGSYELSKSMSDAEIIEALTLQ